VITDGLNILKSFLTSGLILAPEVVTWKQPLIDGTNRTTVLTQKRISFTELSRNEIVEHSKRFGPFSLEFNITTLRKLGLLPVIYMPQGFGNEKDFSNIGLSIVTQINDIKYTIIQLHHLSQYTNLDFLKKQNSEVNSISPDAVFNLQNINPESQIEYSYQVPFKNIVDILSYIGYRNAPLDLMIGILTLMQNLFYPTDDTIHDSVMEYYRQREWRLLSGLAIEGNLQTRHLKDDEKLNLLKINNRFWSKELNDGSTSFRRVDNADVIETFQGKHLATLIEAVIVPPDAYDEAKSMFGEKVITV
jgi:hypothetical protein